MPEIDPVDENDLFVVLNTFRLPLYKMEDELYQHYVLTRDHRRAKPKKKEEFVSFLNRMENQKVFSSLQKRG